MSLNMTPGVTPVSRDIYDLHMTIFWICVVIGVIVFSFLFYAIINHRKSKGVTPAQFHEHRWIELTWTIVPFLILVIMAIPATLVLHRISDTSKPDLTIKITAYQWKWRYEYLDQGISFFSNIATPYQQIHNLIPKDQNYLRTVDHPLVLPMHKKIRFLITSNDVIHSWWVPDFGIKRDAVPGFINESWARINRAGTYHGQCAELCGINHAYMPIVVTVLGEKDFSDWMSNQKNPTATTPSAPTSSITTPSTTTTPAAPAAALTLDQLMQKGEKVYMSLCVVCHQPNGQGMPPTFPAIKQSKIAIGPREPHIHIVMNGKPGTAMQAFKDQLSDEDLAAVITYERNAFGNNTKDLIQPNEIKKARSS